MLKFLSKFRFVYIGVLAAVFILLPFRVFAATEQINNFDVAMTVQRDGALIVQENIAYDFGSNQRRGIFRDIPLTAANGPSLNIQVLGVTNTGGKNVPYITSVKGNDLEIKIGDPNKTVSGLNNYLISYKVQNATRQFSDHQEVYWNATGNGWQVSIQKASVSVTLPDTALTSVNQTCFTGVQGSKATDCSYNYSSGIAHYTVTKPLAAGEGLTFVLGMPVGYLQPVVVAPTSATGSKQAGIVIAVIVAFVVFFSVVAKLSVALLRRRPKPVIPKELKGQPVVTEYNPPGDLLPIDIGTIVDRKTDPGDISATIIGLAVRGYLKIRYLLEPIKFLPDKKDFEFVKLKDGVDLANPTEAIIFAWLFAASDTIKLSQLKKQKYASYSKIKEIIEAEENYLVSRNYFEEKTDALAALLTFLKNKLTPSGLVVMAKILGFREFLQLTEKDKLQLLNAPELQPETFEKFLPYAMVLGVEDKWAKKFVGIYQATPVWYEDPTATSFNTVIFLGAVNSFNNSFNSAISVSNANSSGFSGGFSGGGFGGGGGGSW